MRRVLRFCALWACAVLAGCEVGTEPTSNPTSVPPATENAEVETGNRPAGLPSTAPRLARGRLKFVGDYAAGYEQAMRERKPMLIFFTFEGCHYCHEMANEAFVQPQVVGLAERFVCILVDADAQPELCRQFHVQGYPTVQFVSARGEPLNRMIGKQPGRQLMMAMQAALQNFARHEPRSFWRR